MQKKMHVVVDGVDETTGELQNFPAISLRRLNFSDPALREVPLRVFLSWLPKILHEAPGIQWERMPSQLMGYLVRSVADSPDSIPITLAVGYAMKGMKNYTALKYCQRLTRLLRALRAQYGMGDLAQLGQRDIWDRFVADRTLSRGEVDCVTNYDALASIHLPTYLEELDVRDRAFWEQYVLPQLPRGFINKDGQSKSARAASEQRRKESSDVLVPLFPLLVEIAYLRKQAAERLIKEFRRHRDRALAGEIEVPYHFQYTDRVFSVSEDALTLAEVKLMEQETILSFTLWDKWSWVKLHPKRYGDETRRKSRKQVGPYAPERNMYFLQYHGSPKDLLWCGNLIATRRFGAERKEPGSTNTKRKDYDVSRPGILIPEKNDSTWLRCAWEPDEIIFEPESLYRAVLFATTLAALVLTNGSRLNELLQVSADRFDTLAVDELKDQQPTGRKIGLLVQKLLPKGSRQESERQFFLIGDMAGRLLTEIGQLLEAAHGGTIPVVHPNRSTKEEDLQPEPYLFQWRASDKGRIGVLLHDDVGTLLRFLFHGLTLTTRTGQPIRIAAHLLRHVLATHARTVKNVPAEAVAFLLHHRVTLEGSPRALSIPEATAYYSRLPVDRLLALLFEAQSQLSSSRIPSYLQVPPPRTLEQMDAVLRQVFEQWGLIGPTVFGYCGAGLCIRPNNRALCLDCPHLVPHYSNLRNAKTWRKFYVLQAQLHDTHGHHVDAKQARQMIQYIDDIINVMQIQIRTRQDAGILPFADMHPPATNDEGEKQ
jgi:hypothetical protein